MNIHIDIPANDSGAKMINFILQIIVGALIGWMASIIMRMNHRRDLIMNGIEGVVGALVGGYFLSHLFKVDTVNQGSFSIPALLISLAGAVIVLVISRLFRSAVEFLRCNLFFSLC